MSDNCNPPPIKKLKIHIPSMKLQEVDIESCPKFIKSEPTSASYTVEKKGKKRSKKKETTAVYNAKHGQWRPDDDYLLINSVLQLSDIHAVFKKVKFINYFTEKELEQRWKELLTHETRSVIALKAINNMSAWVKSLLDRRVPFSDEEELILKGVTFSQVYPKTASGAIPSKETYDPFHGLLAENADAFFSGRTVKDLFNHWNLLRKSGYIFDDPTYHSKRSFQMGGDPESFDDMEFLITHSAPSKDPGTVDGGTTTGTSTGVGMRSKALLAGTAPSGTFVQEAAVEAEKELALTEKRRRRLLRVVGEEARRWTYWVEQVTATGVTDRQPGNALASLTGPISRFLIKSRETTFGRRNAVVNPDIDLSCEYHDARISRIQGRIRMDNYGIFYLANFGRRPVFVDGAPVLTGEEVILRDNAIVYIAQLNFRFDVNPNLAEAEVALTQKQNDVKEEKTDALPGTSASAADPARRKQKL